MKKTTASQKQALEKLQSLLARYRNAPAAHDALLSSLDKMPPSMSGAILKEYRLALSSPDGKALCSSVPGMAQLRDALYLNLLPNWDQRDV